MVKGWNRNRGWNNGWGPSRKNRNDSRDLKWVNHSTIETARRVPNEPLEKQRRVTEEETIDGKNGSDLVIVETTQDSNRLIATVNHE